VIFTSAQTGYGVGTAIRGGIPLCFPWFGAGITGTQKPSHGFARTTAWRAVESQENSDGSWQVSLELGPLDLTHESARSFLHQFRATFSARFSDSSLSVSLTVHNAGTSTFTYEEALHTYFAVGDIEQIEIIGLEDSNYLDKTAPAEQEHQGPAGEPITFTGEVDRVYESSRTTTILDRSLGRLITIAKKNSKNTVVWNPWSQRAAEMKDLGNDEWRKFVCVETANVHANAITLEPAQTHTLSAKYTLNRA